MYSIYNTQCFVSARVDETEGTIILQLAHLDKPFVINKDDELYMNHLKNLQVSRVDIEKTFPVGEVEEAPKHPLKG